MLTAMLGSKYRGRRKGIPIREGSVRQARLEAKPAETKFADAGSVQGGSAPNLGQS